MKDKRKIAWLVIGAMFLLAIIGNNIGKKLEPQKKAGSFWSNISQSENITETEIAQGGVNKIAIIKVEGEIIDTDSQPSSILSSATGTSADRIVKEIDKAEKDPQVKALILQINSPGGTAVAGQTITEKLGKFKESGKKLYVGMREVAASAAYEISTPADKIYANPETMTGSIGVIMELTNYGGLYDKLGVQDITIKSGPEKDLGSATRPMTDIDRSILQTMVDESYNNFVATVAKWRKMDEAKVRGLADGRVYTAKQAKESGLIDEIGNMPLVIENAKKDSGAADASVVEYSSGALGGLFSSLFQKIGIANQIGSIFGTSNSNTVRSNKLMHIWMP